MGILPQNIVCYIWLVLGFCSFIKLQLQLRIIPGKFYFPSGKVVILTFKNTKAKKITTEKNWKTILFSKPLIFRL